MIEFVDSRHYIAAAFLLVFVLLILIKLIKRKWYGAFMRVVSAGTFCIVIFMLEDFNKTISTSLMDRIAFELTAFWIMLISFVTFIMLARIEERKGEKRGSKQSRTTRSARGRKSND